MDLENAFNQIDTSYFLREVRRVAPGLARYSDLCYTSDSFVLFGPEKIHSRRRVQGVGLSGAFAFCPGPPPCRLWRRLAHAEAARSLADMAAFNVGDGSICGTHNAVKALLEGFQRGLDERAEPVEERSLPAPTSLGLRRVEASTTTHALLFWEPPSAFGHLLARTAEET